MEHLTHAATATGLRQTGALIDHNLTHFHHMHRRADHDDNVETIALIRRLTNNLTPPEHTCGSRRSLHGARVEPQ